MKAIKNIIITAIALISIFFVSFSWGAGDGRLLDLEPTKHHPDAQGTAYIDNTHVSVHASGLRPNSVYTVWFVNMKPKKNETGAGTAPYMFKTNKWGDGNYSAPLTEAPFGKWSIVMIVLHTNGNPKDMKNMVGALKAPLG